MIDPLEAELAAMTPREPSPELRASLAVRLAAPVRSKSALWICTGGLLVAALVAFLIQRPIDPPLSEPKRLVAPIQLVPAFDDSLPSLWAFRQAMNASPQALEAMFDQQSFRTLPSEPESTRAFPFVTSG